VKFPACLRKLAAAWCRFDFSDYEGDYWTLFRDADGSWVVARSGDAVAELAADLPCPVFAWAASVVAKDGAWVTEWIPEGDDWWSAELSEATP
jgi:hypothetical protein